jgi:hypothetical protein
MPRPWRTSSGRPLARQRSPFFLLALQEQNNADKEFFPGAKPWWVTVSFGTDIPERARRHQGGGTRRATSTFHDSMRRTIRRLPETSLAAIDEARSLEAALKFRRQTAALKHLH